MDETTHFGFQTVASADKAKMVGEVFNRVAQNYDVMNDLMSAGIHRLWKEQFINNLNPQQGMKLLDVAGGTGDIAFRFLEYTKSKSTPPAFAGLLSPNRSSSVVVCDINPNMLNVGAERARKFGYVPAKAEHITPVHYLGDSRIQSLLSSENQIEFVEGDAMNLPFPDNSFDAYTIAFGLRNVTDTNKALREARRVLKRGGRFMCLEFSHLENALFQQLYDTYSFNVIPALGELVAKDRDAYQYLVESIRRFPTQPQLVEMMKEAGFGSVKYTNMSLGIVAMHSGFKL